MNLSIFQEILTPFLTVSLISTKINLFVHWYFQRQFGYCWRQSQKKSIFPPRNHYFGVFHIDHHPMHYSITKKHTLSLHVKNIDIKNYAINSATAVVCNSFWDYWSLHLQTLVNIWPNVVICSQTWQAKSSNVVEHNLLHKTQINITWLTFGNIQSISANFDIIIW